MKYLRNKFINQLGVESLEPEQRAMFKKVVHEAFISYNNNNNNNSKGGSKYLVCITNLLPTQTQYSTH